MKRSLNWITRLGATVFVISAAAVWIVSVEIVQKRVIQSAGDDADAQFEAASESEALWWFPRVVGPVLLLRFLITARRFSRVARFSQAPLFDFNRSQPSPDVLRLRCHHRVSAS